PKFKKYQTRTSVEYKATGWKLSAECKQISFTDGFKAGSFKLKGTRDLNFDQLEPIHRVRVVRRSDGYYAQIVLEVERTEKHDPTRWGWSTSTPIRTAIPLRIPAISAKLRSA
ncbi:MAG: hypothetical protein Q6L68_15890, partial [Thermostichus sp. DG02_5_bins_236]